jgi:hypothetical protein
MARRWKGKMNGERYLANTAKTQVHDLDNEKTGRNECQIDEIIAAGNDGPFTSQKAANDTGYDNWLTVSAVRSSSATGVVGHANRESPARSLLGIRGFRLI